MFGGSRHSAIGQSYTRAQHSFATTPGVSVPRSILDRSHSMKTAFDAAYLIPIYCDEALPGDTIKCNAVLFGRLQKPVYPIMDNLWIDTFWFAVANRLLWNNWEKFCGAQDNPADSIDFEVPQFTAHQVAANSLSDYMGLPILTANNIQYNSLWHRAYNLIWNEFFRDENLNDSVTVDKDDGPDDIADYVLLKRNKRHDYFTSCLPWTQKGDPVTLPLGTSAPVVSAGDGEPEFTYTDGSVYTGHIQASGPSPADVTFLDGAVTKSGTLAWSTTALEADLTNATAATINAVRLMFQTQRFLEKDARGGTRYTELLKSHFGVTSPDSRLQRPECIGLSRDRILIAPVPSTDSYDDTPGKIGALGVVGAAPRWMKSFTEHCVIIGLANVRADLTYQQGMPRMFRRRSRYDFYWPSFAHLGEQSVLNEEIYCDGSANDALTFGFQERYSEYRYKPSYTTANMRSDHASSLDTKHLALDFGSLPALNATFMADNPPLDRVVVTPSQPHIELDMHMRLECARPMPVRSVPGLIDHF